MRRYMLSKKESRNTLSMLEELFRSKIDADKVEVCIDKKTKFILIDGEPMAVEDRNMLIPLLNWLIKNREKHNIPKIIVDKGAVKPISRGADVMAPGVIGVEGSFGSNEIVIVVDEVYNAPIAVVKALIDSESLKSTSKGKVALNIHHFKDSYWKKAESIKT